MPTPEETLARIRSAPVRDTEPGPPKPSIEESLAKIRGSRPSVEESLAKIRGLETTQRQGAAKFLVGELVKERPAIKALTDPLVEGLKTVQYAIPVTGPLDYLARAGTVKLAELLQPVSVLDVGMELVGQGMVRGGLQGLQSLRGAVRGGAAGARKAPVAARIGGRTLNQVHDLALRVAQANKEELPLREVFGRDDLLFISQHPDILNEMAIFGAPLRPEAEAIELVLKNSERVKAAPIEGLLRSVDATKSVAQETIARIRAGKPLTNAEQMQISQAVAIEVLDGQIPAAEAAKMMGLELSKVGVDPVVIANAIRQTASKFGTGLGQWSQVRKELGKVFKDNPAAMEALAPGKTDSALEAFAAWWRPVDNVRRGIMTSQLATTARNIISQTGRYSLSVLEDASSALWGRLTGTVQAKDAAEFGMAKVVSAFRLLTPGQRLESMKILDKFPVQKAKLLKAPIHDVLVGSDSLDQKIAGAFNIFNSFQEMGFRKMAFDAHLRQSMILGKVAAKDVSKDMVDGALKHSLEVTFAAVPESAAGKGILGLYNAIPVLTALGNPFPRFWLNAMKFIYEFSPVPLMRASTYAKMASKDPRVATQALTRAGLGTAIIASGFAADQADMTGDRWFEVKGADGKMVDIRGAEKKTQERFDLRPFAPFTSSFFIGRLMSRYMKMGDEAFLQIRPEDWVNAAASLRRTDATGLPLADALFASNVSGFQQGVLRIVSNWANSFTVTARTALDVAAQFNPEEALPRSTREEPLKGPLANIPFLQRQLPVRPSPLRSTPEPTNQPLRRQLTGVTSKMKTRAELEADRIGIVPRDIYPRINASTRVQSREMERVIVEHMGPKAEQLLEYVMDLPMYQNPPDKVNIGKQTLKLSKMRVQQSIFKMALDDARRYGQAIAAKDNPKEALAILINNQEAFLRHAFSDDDLDMDALRESLGVR